MVPETEQLVICRDRASGLVAVIAIDDTTLGPALGGIRMLAYPSEEAAVAECRRLARVMTLKNALAGVGFGGGKAVILHSAAPGDRAAALRAFGRFATRTGGAYIPAVDMGTSVEDLRIVAETASDVACDDVDPSPATAVGVHAAITVAVRTTGLAPSLDSVVVLVQGVGNVGARLARLLAQDGAAVLVADTDGRRAARVARDVSGSVVAPEEVVAAACDVFAPCAVARVIDDAAIPRLRARVVVGSANDVLDHPGLARELAARGIAHVPDFVANAGGVIQVRALRDRWSAARLRAALLDIGRRSGDILEEAAHAGVTPLEVAERAAYARLDSAGRRPFGDAAPRDREVRRAA